jgi:hypothetical protein
MACCRGGGFWHWTVRLVLVLFVAAAGAAGAANAASKKELPAACKPSDDKKAKSKHHKSKSAKPDDDDDDDDEGIHFDLDGNCGKLTGGVSYTYQQAKKTAAGLPVIVNRNGTVSAATISNSVSANLGLEVTRQTALGEFKTTAGVEWSKATDDGTQNGSASVSGWSVGLGGLTVGYTGTLMSFWDGSFLTTASSPGRSASTVVYEYESMTAIKWRPALNRTCGPRPMPRPASRASIFPTPSIRCAGGAKPTP